MFSLLRCILSYVKIVKTEDNAKQKIVFFIFSSPSKLDLADIRSGSMGLFGQNFRQRRKKSPLTSVCQFYHSISYYSPLSSLSGTRQSTSMEMHRKKVLLILLKLKGYRKVVLHTYSLTVLLTGLPFGHRLGHTQSFLVK